MCMLVSISNGYMKGYDVGFQVKSDDGTHHLLVSKFFGVEDRAEVIVDDFTATARKYAFPSVFVSSIG